MNTFTCPMTEDMKLIYEDYLAANPHVTYEDIFGWGVGAEKLKPKIPGLDRYSARDINNTNRTLSKYFREKFINEGRGYHDDDVDTYMEDVDDQPANKRRMTTRPPASPHYGNHILNGRSSSLSGPPTLNSRASPNHYAYGRSSSGHGSRHSPFRSGASPSMRSNRFAFGSTSGSGPGSSPFRNEEALNHHGSYLISESYSTLSDVSGIQENFGSLESKQEPKYNLNDGIIMQAITTTCEKDDKMIIDIAKIDHNISVLVKQNNETLDRNFKAESKSTNHSAQCGFMENENNSITKYKAVDAIKEARKQFKEETNDLLLNLKKRDNNVDSTLRKTTENLNRMRADFEAGVKEEENEEAARRAAAESKEAARRAAFDARMEVRRQDFAALKAETEREIEQINEDKNTYKEQTIQVQGHQEAVSIKLLAYEKWLEVTCDVRRAHVVAKYSNDPSHNADYQRVLEQRGALQVKWKMGHGTLDDLKMMIGQPLSQPQPQSQTQTPQFVFGVNNSTNDTAKNGIASFNIGSNKN